MLFAMAIARLSRKIISVIQYYGIPVAKNIQEIGGMLHASTE